MNSSIKDSMAVGPYYDIGHFLRKSMSRMAEKLRGCVRLSQFEGLKDFLLTRENALEIEKRLFNIETGIDKLKSADFNRCQFEVSLHERLEILTEDIQLKPTCQNPYCITPYIEGLIKTFFLLI